MHPEVVRELVREQFEELERLLSDRPELDVSGVELDDTDIFITLSVETTTAAPVPPELMLELAGNKKLLLPGQPGHAGQAIVFGQQVQAVPLLGQTATRDLLLRVGCDGYNGRPPCGQLMRSDDRTVPLPDEEWPREPAGQGIVQAHPVYKRKFFCRPGFREFHELDQHADTPWDGIRETRTLGWIVMPLLSDLQQRWKLV